MTNTETIARHETRVENASMGCKKAVCSCGWESSATNTPHTLSRTARSHKNAVSKGR